MYQNTIARAEGLPGSSQGASSTAEFYFDDNLGVDAVVKVNIDQLAMVHGQAPRAGLSGASSDIHKVRLVPFVVRAWGIVVGSTAGNFTVNLDAGDSTTIASNTTIFTSGAKALDADDTLATWDIKAELMLAPGVTSKLNGTGYARVNDAAIATIAITTESVEDIIANGYLSFKVSGTFSASDADNRAVCQGLVVCA